MKKVLSVIFALMLMLAMMVSCGNNSNNNGSGNGSNNGGSGNGGNNSSIGGVEGPLVDIEPD